jgi:hypothetical protein
MKQRILFALFVLTFLAASAFAGTIGLQLNRTTGVKVPDAAGWCEYASGTVTQVNTPKGNVKIGTYVATRRFVNGSAGPVLTVTFTFGGQQHVTLLGEEVGQTGSGNGGVGPASNGANHWPGWPFRSEHMDGPVAYVFVDFTGTDPKLLPQFILYTL